jgi:lactoylglutathione lyase
MKTLHTAYRVVQLDRSLEFYARVGFRELGRVAFEDGSMLVMLNLPGDGDVVTLELVYDPRLGTGLSHIVVQVDDLEAELVELRDRGVAFEVPQRPGGDDGPKTVSTRAICRCSSAGVVERHDDHTGDRE